MWSIIIIVIFLSILRGLSQVEAHPRDVSSEGQHYCWTDCDYVLHLDTKNDRISLHEQRKSVMIEINTLNYDTSDTILRSM
mgnify:CR=1 FL=1